MHGPLNVKFKTKLKKMHHPLYSGNIFVQHFRDTEILWTALCNSNLKYSDPFLASYKALILRNVLSDISNNYIQDDTKNGKFCKTQQKLKKSKKKIYWQKLNHYNLPFKAFAFCRACNTHRVTQKNGNFWNA